MNLFRPIKKGATDQSVVIRIIDSTAFTPEQAVAFDTATLALWYRRDGGEVTAITPAELATTDAAHADGGIIHLDDGYYRIDLPDAAVTTGVDGVAVGGSVTNMIVNGAYAPLTAHEPADMVDADVLDNTLGTPTDADLGRIIFLSSLSPITRWLIKLRR